jgi:hypothetical protein
MSRRYHQWTDEEIERLQTLLAARASANRAAAALGRPIQSVRIKARQLGKHFPSSFAERRRLKELLKN